MTKIKKTDIQGVAVITALGLAVTGHPVWAIAPCLVHARLFIPQSLKSFRVLTPVNKFRSAVASAIAMAFLTSPAVLAQIQFSFLLESTQGMADTCIFNQIAGLIVISGLLFGALRLGVMFGLAYIAFEAWQEKRKQQEYSDQVKTIVYGILAIVAIGVIEPLIVRSC